MTHFFLKCSTPFFTLVAFVASSVTHGAPLPGCVKMVNDTCAELYNPDRKKNAVAFKINGETKWTRRTESHGVASEIFYLFSAQKENWRQLPRVLTSIKQD
jgi:hypothetical protein